MASVSNACLTHEVSDDEVEDEVAEEEVGEGPLLANAAEFVGGIDLHAQRDGEDEAANGGDEAGEEGVEGEGAHEGHVDELDDAGQHDVREEDVDDLQLLRCTLLVFLAQRRQHASNARHLSSTPTASRSNGF